MKRYIYLIIILLTIGVSACAPSRQTDEKTTLTVSIEPLRYFTEAIAGDRFKVVSMVPEGNSPETYDPTPQQLVAQAKSKAFLRIGYIGFEQTWLKKLQDNAPGQPFYDLSKGVALMAGSCSHEEDNAHNHAHEGVEPHIWNSVKNARIIANNIFQALSEIDNEQTPYYQHRLDSLLQVIDNTGKEMDTLMENADRTFLIYHPALTYFARDYGLNQISIEADGKEPSPAHLKELIQLCREEQPKIIFVQKEFDTRNAEIIARELQVNVIPINPLSYHWNEEMINIAKALSNP